MNQQSHRPRETELDLLRSVALFFIICIHINARTVGLYPILTAGWAGIKIWYMIWCVPLFVMISGRFFGP